MSTRLLYVFSLIACLGAAYLYFYQDKIENTRSATQERYDYWANDIRAVQTNDEGLADFQLASERLVHDPQTDSLTLNDLTAQLKHVGDDQATFVFSADTAIWQQPVSELMLMGGVNVTRQPVSGSSVSSLANTRLTFDTKALQANIKTKTLVGKEPITLKMGNSFIQANSLNADLNRGEYQFDKLHAQYTQ